jgi:hypothetical protein
VLAGPESVLSYSLQINAASAIPVSAGNGLTQGVMGAFSLFQPAKATVQFSAAAVMLCLFEIHHDSDLQSAAPITGDVIFSSVQVHANVVLCCKLFHKGE